MWRKPPTHIRPCDLRWRVVHHTEQRSRPPPLLRCGHPAPHPPPHPPPLLGQAPNELEGHQIHPSPHHCTDGCTSPPRHSWTCRQRAPRAVVAAAKHDFPQYHQHMGAEARAVATRSGWSRAGSLDLGWGHGGLCLPPVARSLECRPRGCPQRRSPTFHKSFSRRSLSASIAPGLWAQQHRSAHAGRKCCSLSHVYGSRSCSQFATQSSHRPLADGSPGRFDARWGPRYSHQHIAS
jgi:hypothetical protein